jgi:hypothetical protein
LYVINIEKHHSFDLMGKLKIIIIIIIIIIINKFEKKTYYYWRKNINWIFLPSKHLKQQFLA